MEQSLNWIKIAATVQEISWQENLMAIVEAEGKKLTLAQHKNHIYAFAHKCPHASGIMANGSIDESGKVVCPLHRYKFSIENGRNTSGEGYYLKTYPVKQDETGVYIGFKQTSFFNF